MLENFRVFQVSWRNFRTEDPMYDYWWSTFARIYVFLQYSVLLAFKNEHPVLEPILPTDWPKCTIRFSSYSMLQPLKNGVLLQKGHDLYISVYETLKLVAITKSWSNYDCFNELFELIILRSVLASIRYWFDESTFALIFNHIR